MSKRGKRYPSIRAYREQLDRIIAEAYEGKRPIEDLPKFSSALKTASEMFVTEQRLAQAGADREAPHPLGERGGGPDLERGQYEEITEREEASTTPDGPTQTRSVERRYGRPDPKHGAEEIDQRAPALPKPIEGGGIDALALFAQRRGDRVSAKTD